MSTDTITTRWLQGQTDTFLPKDGPLARVHVLSNEIEAHVLHDVLQAEGIVHIIQSYRDTTFDGLFQATRGWGCIITREEDSQWALQWIHKALAHFPDTNDEP